MKNKLLNEAKKARNKAYAPYSSFNVGAALLTEEGNIYTGCNIENASFPLTCCAERVAMFNAISEGEREFKEMAVIADTLGPVSPCGACRQVMTEFFEPDARIYLADIKENIYEMTIQELLPYSFSLEHNNK